MAQKVAEYEAILSLNTGDFKKGMADAESSFGSFSSKMASVGKGIAVGLTAALTAASAAIVKIGKDAIEAYAEYEQLVGGVETLFKDSSDTVIKNAANAYKTAGMSANEYMATVTSFSASLLQSLGGDTVEAAKKADMAIVDMSDNANKMGTAIESIQNAYQGFAKQNYTMLDNLKLGYGGTKEEMQRLLADAQAISGIEYDISSYADVVDAIHVIQTEMGITGTTAKEASTTIQGSISSMKAAWTNLLTGMTDETQDFDTLMQNFFDSVVTVGENLIPRISVVLNGITSLVTTLAPQLVAMIPELLNQLLPALVSGAVSLVNAVVAALPGIISALMAALPTLIQGITQLIQGILAVLPTLLLTIVDTVVALLPVLVQAICDMIPSLVETVLLIVDAIIASAPVLIQALLDCLPMLLECVLQMVESLIQGLLGAIPNIIAALPQIIISIIDFLLSAIPQIIECGINLITSLVAALPQIIQAIVAAIPQIINGIINAVLNAIPQIIQAGINLLISLIQALPQIITTIVTAIPEIISGLVNAIANNIPAIIQAGVELLISLVKNLPTIIKEVIKAIPQIITSLVKAIGEGVPQIVDAGLNLVKGLFNGISNAVSWLYGKLKGWVSSVLSYIKGLFGIHSPSKETAVFGKYVAQGLGVGIEDNADAANKASKKLSDNVLNTFGEMADEVTDIENGIFGDKTIEGGLSVAREDSIKSSVDVNDVSLISGFASLIDKMIERNAAMFDKLTDAVSIGSNNGISTSNKTITFNMGNISVSGVLDKDAKEQVKQIAGEQVDELVDILEPAFTI